MVGQSKKKRTLQALLYLSPALIGIGTFVIYPLIKAFSMSFYQDYNVYIHYGWGLTLENYKYVLTDPMFHKALYNTFVYMIFSVPISILIALGIAVLLNSKIKFTKMYQTVYFLPYVTNVIAIGLAFQFIFHSNYGILNAILGMIGIDPILWLNDPNWSMPALIIFGVWGGLAFKIIVFLAGLQNIDPQFYQAAKVDGTSRWRMFSKITVPLLSPIIAYITIISMIGAFKTFAQVVALFGGQPGQSDSALTIVYYVYEKFYAEGLYPIAATASVILFAIILMFTAVQMWVNKKKVHY
jgi:multiple sugar transport system permease protein